MDEKKKDVLLETTADAPREAKTLIRAARSGAIATIEPGTGWPIATRVGVSTDFDGAPIILISRLAAHTGALLADPRCSLLIGYPGKGDPLAHGRVTIACETREVERDSEEHVRLDTRYLIHQQKAKLYSGLGDFRYFRLEPKSASANPELAATEPSAVEHMNQDHAEAVGLYAEHFAKAPAGKWRLIGVDAEGMDLADGDDIRRVWFESELTSSNDMHTTLVKMAGEARRALNRPLRDARVAP
jgi:putative heme iron utilization protein